jgi:hypothetical protein
VLVSSYIDSAQTIAPVYRRICLCASG